MKMENLYQYINITVYAYFKILNATGKGKTGYASISLEHIQRPENIHELNFEETRKALAFECGVDGEDVVMITKEEYEEATKEDEENGL